jgi:TetR/AcrR family transcriptional regulator
MPGGIPQNPRGDALAINVVLVRCHHHRCALLDCAARSNEVLELRYRSQEMSSSNPAPEKRRVGRPRKRLSAESSGEPREQILSAAAALFAARGIGEVSMLEIAEQSGLGQSSLYYWYRRKELIVAELLQQVNRLPLAFAKQLESEGDGADVQLYRLVQFDVRTVCDFPLEITEVHRLSRREKAAFETYWKERRELTATLERLITRGVEAGAFRSVDAYLCALTIIAEDESVQLVLARSEAQGAWPQARKRSTRGPLPRRRGRRVRGHADIGQSDRRPVASRSREETRRTPYRLKPAGRVPP